MDLACITATVLYLARRKNGEKERGGRAMRDDAGTP